MVKRLILKANQDSRLGKDRVVEGSLRLLPRKVLERSALR